MKYLFILFLLVFDSGYSQEIFEYEKRVANIEHYNHEEITVKNSSSNITLSGSLVTPKGSFDKIVLIVPGSGMDTRYSHYILADSLLRNNIAAFRFDESGVGKSTGKYSELATDLSQDLYLFYSVLKNKFPQKKIGIIGHSIGGIAALEIIQRGAVPDFVILIETPVLKNGAFVLNQIKVDYDNSIPDVMKKGKSKEDVTAFLDDFFKVVAADTLQSRNEIKKYIKSKGFDSRFVMLMDDKFLMEMLHTNLEETVQNITIPTLYLTGTKNKIINYKEETSLIKSLRNKNIEVQIFDGLNHWLTVKNATVGTSLYNMDKEPLNKIISWTLQL